MASIILKATEQCNSNCYYCDVVFKQQTRQSMALEVLELVFRRSNEYLLEHPEERLDILWHGGEPLLLGSQYYWAALEYQERHCGQTQGRIHHSIQTNLTCFDESFVEIFQKLGIGSVGTSYDPEPHMRGPGKEINSDEYNAKFMKGMAILERYGLGWGMIYVVTKKSLRDPLSVFFFLTNLRLSGGINFNPVLIYDEGRRDIAITPVEFVEFLGAIFPAWWSHRSRYPDVEPFKSLVANIIEGQTSLGCADSGRCTYQHINVAPNGDASQCGRSADWGLLFYGNIRDKSFDEILRDPQRNQLEERVHLLPQTECKECKYWELCHGGCPLDAYSQHKDFMHKSEWCVSRQRFIEQYFEPITGARYGPRGRTSPG